MSDTPREVLIVDDHQPTREVMARWLQAAGFAINEAPDAERALEILAQKPILVATIDKDMPGQPGTWLITQIQQRFPGVAMLLSTGDDQIPSHITLSRGVQGYLVKPLSRELVVNAVKDAEIWARVASKQARTNSPAADPVDSWLQGRAGRPPKSVNNDPLAE